MEFPILVHVVLLFVTSHNEWGWIFHQVILNSRIYEVSYNGVVGTVTYQNMVKTLSAKIHWARKPQDLSVTHIP